MTALVALERKVSLNEDDMILINVGVSGIGLAAVDLATNVFRAKVFLYNINFLLLYYAIAYYRFASKILVNEKGKLNRMQEILQI